jgi:DNA ligase (NAD+)
MNSQNLQNYQKWSKDQFTKTLQNLDDVYYNGGESDVIVSDAEYDFLREKYEEKYGKWEHIGAIVKHKKTVQLPKYLGSMDKYKMNNEKEIGRFSGKYPGKYLVEEKLDGVSGLLVYTPKNIKLYTRGNGYLGVDISNLIKYLKVPELKVKETLYIRGEIIIPRDVFQKKFSHTFKNARNLVSGIVNSKRVNVKNASAMDFVCYDVIESNMTPSQQMDFLKKHSFYTVKYFILEEISPEILNNHLEKMKGNSKYEIDGIIIISDGIYPRETSGNPKHAFAFKNNIMHVQTTVKNVLWNPSKHSVLKPQVEIEPVDIGGTTVTFATGHNAKYIVNNKIGPGSTIEITRSGDVIPFITNVIKPGKIVYPTEKYEWNSTKVDFVLLEDNPKVISKQILYFCQTMNFKGIGEATTDKLVEHEIRNISKLLKCRVSDLEHFGFGKVESKNIYNSIHNNIINVDLALLMGASGCFGFGLGRRKIQTILDVHENIIIKKQTIENISKIFGWTDKSASQFLEGLESFKKFLKENRNITYKVFSKKKCGNKKVVFSGFRNKDLQSKAEQKGYEIIGNISSKVNILVVKDVNGKSGKIKKAEKMGIKIISINDFEKKL